MIKIVIQTLGLASALFFLSGTAYAETLHNKSGTADTGLPCKIQTNGDIWFKKNGKWIKSTKSDVSCRNNGSFNNEGGLNERLSVPVKNQVIQAPSGALGFSNSTLTPSLRCPANTTAQPNGTCLANQSFSFGNIQRLQTRTVPAFKPQK